MNITEKANAMREAAQKCGDEYRLEGKPEMAHKVTAAIHSLPIESAARLFDFLANRPKG